MKKPLFENILIKIVLPLLVLAALMASAVPGRFFSVYAAGPEEAGDTAFTPAQLHNAYLYHLEDGQLKYWLDLSGDSIKLHCFFRSGGPEYYEKLYTLFPDETGRAGNTLLIREVRVDGSTDISSWFQFMAVTFSDDRAVLSVVRDEKTLAGGGSDNLLTGSYVMKSARPENSSPSENGSPDPGTYDDYIRYSGAAWQEGERHLRYWIEFHDDFELHCLFSEGLPSPGYYETVYTLSPYFENSPAQELLIRTVTDRNGLDVTDSFQVLRFSFSANDTVEMDVLRDETKLAGGSSNNLLSGRYTMKQGAALAAAAALLSEREQTDRADARAEFTPEELCAMAQEYYSRHFDFFPPEADCVKNDNSTYTIHLYEIVDDGRSLSHTATSAWYTVDASGIGSNDITGDAVDLTR